MDFTSEGVHHLYLPIVVQKLDYNTLNYVNTNAV